MHRINYKFKRERERERALIKGIYKARRKSRKRGEVGKNREGDKGVYEKEKKEGTKKKDELSEKREG